MRGVLLGVVCLSVLPGVGCLAQGGARGECGRGVGRVRRGQGEAGVGGRVGLRLNIIVIIIIIIIIIRRVRVVVALRVPKGLVNIIPKLFHETVATKLPAVFKKGVGKHCKSFR